MALQAGTDRRLTLIDAPTGYGKTVLIAAWCDELSKRTERVIAWLSLAATDNDPALLTRYLIGGFRRAASTLVLDDYHVITEPACQALVQFLVDHAPDSLALIVSTRASPPIALGSLRAARQLVELGAADLRFTAAEAEQLLVEREELALAAETVASLAVRTEGWPAGLYLAARWLRGQDDQDADAARFAGDNRHVVDYLSEAVLDQLDDRTREFLLRTSIVDRLCASLAQAITEAPAAGVLEEIERSNLFLVPLDENRAWYRYHHLFRQMPRGELARQRPELIGVLHQRASAWYRDRSLVSEAVEHATAAGDHTGALALVEEAERLLASFEDAGTLTATLADVRRRITLARPRRRQPDSSALTEAELAILRLLPSPRSQRAIASELSVSINTVKTHTASIYRKLGVSSRNEAVMRASDLNLV